MYNLVDMKGEWEDVCVPSNGDIADDPAWPNHPNHPYFTFCVFRNIFEMVEARVFNLCVYAGRQCQILVLEWQTTHRRGQGHMTHFKFWGPFFGMGEAMHFKFGVQIDVQMHTDDTTPPKGCVQGQVTSLNFGK